MFVVVLNYVKPLDVIDAHLAAHREFLGKHYESGVFIVSGRRVPRTGGVILARGVSRDALMEILRQDPFYEQGIVRHEVIEFRPNLTVPELTWLVEK
jgi:uncharacterized protein YciI